jgi:DNA invertase Pin-like site-specific DNA recombinase
VVVLRQQIDTTTPTGRLVFHILGAIDEFQRELIVEGSREGLDAAWARGRTGGRKPKLNSRQTEPSDNRINQAQEQQELDRPLQMRSFSPDRAGCECYLNQMLWRIVE